jgi:hypothetical protein
MYQGAVELKFGTKKTRGSAFSEAVSLHVSALFVTRATAGSENWLGSISLADPCCDAI